MSAGRWRRTGSGRPTPRRRRAKMIAATAAVPNHRVKTAPSMSRQHEPHLVYGRPSARDIQEGQISPGWLASMEADGNESGRSLEGPRPPAANVSVAVAIGPIRITVATVPVVVAVAVPPIRITVATVPVVAAVVLPIIPPAAIYDASPVASRNAARFRATRGRRLVTRGTAWIPDAAFSRRGKMTRGNASISSAVLRSRP